MKNVINVEMSKNVGNMKICEMWKCLHRKRLNLYFLLHEWKEFPLFHIYHISTLVFTLFSLP